MKALSSRIAYENLRYLCKNTKEGFRDTQAQAAVEFTQQFFLVWVSTPFFLQELMVKGGYGATGKQQQSFRAYQEGMI